MRARCMVALHSRSSCTFLLSVAFFFSRCIHCISNGYEQQKKRLLLDTLKVSTQVRDAFFMRTVNILLEFYSHFRKSPDAIAIPNIMAEWEKYFICPSINWILPILMATKIILDKPNPIRLTKTKKESSNSNLKIHLYLFRPFVERGTQI